MTYPSSISLRSGQPDFLDLPWDLPLTNWKGVCSRLEEVPRGVSRHPVVFVNYDGALYALKELPKSVAESEHNLLQRIEELGIPSVIAVGHAQTSSLPDPSSVLITRYLENSLPFRTLFMRQSLTRYCRHLLDAIAGLLVQLHLAGIFWGDCSLSNTLFRRDAGALRAYLVDAETAEIHTGHCPPRLRFYDLQIMEENVSSDLLDMGDGSLFSDKYLKVPLTDIGATIRVRYQRLWEEITREDLICAGEHFRIQERIRTLNSMGFSVGDVELSAMNGGSQIRLRVEVTGRNFHRNQLYNLTGLDAEELQAKKMMNEIQEERAALSQAGNRNIPLDVAAYHWMENIYKPVVEMIYPLLDKDTTQAELYCQVLEHKWYLSERAQHDVGHQMATKDYLKEYGERRRDENQAPDNRISE
jgi:tRNA A-37 threonylcarbamoyl transferase component Bud32